MLNNASVWESLKRKDVEMRKYWEHSTVAYINLRRWFERASSLLFVAFPGWILLVCAFYLICLCWDMIVGCMWILGTKSSILQWLFLLDYTVLINTIRTAAPRAWSRITSCAQFHKLSVREERWKGPSIISPFIETKILRVWLCCGRNPEHQPVVLHLALWWMNDITNLPDTETTVSYHIR